MKISIIQPCFVPWLGYFEQIALSDVFVYLDDVQYTKKDWRNSNQLKTPNGVKNIYVPVCNPSRDTLIKDVYISYNEKWEDNILNKLREWYKKSPHYEEIIELIKPILLGKYEKLVELNFHLNNVILNYIGITIPIHFASGIPRNIDGKNERIIEVCKSFNADILYDGKAAQAFIDIELFKKHGITVIFQHYQHTPHKQLWGEFVPYMSILDALMNEGKRTKEIILSSPVPEILKK
ncbi:MAG: WbqC family protein [Bacteroidota bacterium]